MTRPALVKASDLKRLADEIAAGKIGVIYFVTNPEAETVKVGYSVNLPRRLEVLQTGNHIPLVQYSFFTRSFGLHPTRKGCSTSCSSLTRS